MKQDVGVNEEVRNQCPDQVAEKASRAQIVIFVHVS